MVSRLETARSVLDECCYFTENDALEEEISELEERVSELVEEPEKVTEINPPKKPISVPPTTDGEVYESWLDTLEESEGEDSKSSTTGRTSGSVRESRLRVPPTTDGEVYESWLDTLED